MSSKVESATRGTVVRRRTTELKNSTILTNIRQSSVLPTLTVQANVSTAISALLLILILRFQLR